MDELIEAQQENRVCFAFSFLFE